MSLIVASITFGICVDDTIHVVSGYLARRRAGMAPQESLHDVLSEVGSAICFTSIVLFCGFSVMTMSSLVPNVNLGLFSAIIIATALICELLLLPALIALVEKSEQPSLASTPSPVPATADQASASVS
jgi:predicted RND superfamily exporter protein